MTVKLAETDGETNDIEWVMHAVPFTVAESGPYCFGFQARNAMPLQFYKFSVQEVAETDMSANDLNGNTIANTGTESIYLVDVTNNGYNTVEKFTVELVDEEGYAVASCEYTTPIKSQMTQTVNIGWTPANEGVVTVRPRVVLEGDSNNDNNLGREFTVTVFGSGKMLHIKDGTSGTGYAPFYDTYPHSAVQTIYPAERMGDYTNADIKAIVYYIYTAMEQTVSSVNFEVALACVDKKDFYDNVMIEEELLTPVYEDVSRLTRPTRLSPFCSTRRSIIPAATSVYSPATTAKP